MPKTRRISSTSTLLLPSGKAHFLRCRGTKLHPPTSYANYRTVEKKVSSRKCLSFRQISKQIQTTRASSCVGEKKANNGCSTMRARKPLMRAWRLCGKSQGRGRGQSWCDPGLRSCAFSFPGPLLAVPRWLLEELFNAGCRNDPVGRGRSTGVSATRCEIRAGPGRVPLHTLAWVLAALLGGIPYVLEGTFKNLIDSTFESMSDFTITEATLLAVLRPKRSLSSSGAV